VGHEYLRKLEEEILPKWKAYLNSDNKKLSTIFDLQKKLEKGLKKNRA